MVDMAPDDPPKLPVERLAQFLLGCAREDPTLLARSTIDPIQRRGANPRGPLGKPIPLAKPVPLPLMLSAARKNPELEELVSIAVACARRAEDALEHARDVSAMARRRMSMVAAITGAGIMIAAAAVVLGRPVTLADSRLTETAGAVPGVTGQAAPQLVAMRSEVVAPPDTGTSSDARAAGSPARAAAPTGSNPPDTVSMAETATSHRPVPRAPRVTEAAVVPGVEIAPASAAPRAPVLPQLVEAATTPAAVSDARVPPATHEAAPQPGRDASSGTGSQASASVVQRSAQAALTEPVGTAASAPVSRPVLVARATDVPVRMARAAPEDNARPVAPVRAAGHNYRRRTWREAHYYPSYRQDIYVPSPPVILSQVVSDVRRNLYAIFH